MEWILGKQGGKLAAKISPNYLSKVDSFWTAIEEPLQIGLLRRGIDQPVHIHSHNVYSRTIEGTWEILYIKLGSGRCVVFDSDNTLVATLQFREGDFLILLSGSHGMTFFEDTEIIEFKQGPYFADLDKIYHSVKEIAE